MRRFKKGFAVLLAISLSIGFPGYAAKASEKFCSGSHSLYYAGTETMVSYRQHTVFRKSGSNHTVCNVVVTEHYNRVNCSECVYYTLSRFSSSMEHALEKDPEHKPDQGW